MTETALVVASAVQAGVSYTPSTPSAGGNNFVNDGTCFLIIQAVTNPVTITVTGQALGYDGAAHNQASVSVVAGNTAVMGPFQRIYFNDSSNLCHITSNETSTTKIGVVSCVMKQ
jgi:hypothetical protein